jgi:hypothetical protein
MKDGESFHDKAMSLLWGCFWRFYGTVLFSSFLIDLHEPLALEVGPFLAYGYRKKDNET